MATIRYYLFLFFLLVFSSVKAKNIPVRQSGLIGRSIVEFIPEGFDQSKVPSLMLQKEPSIQKAVPAGWQVFPEFTLNQGKASAVVHLAGDISLYGGGEVTGPLLRNGQTIKLWNTDNGAYGTDNGKRLYQTHPWVMGVRKDGTAFGILFDSYWKAELKTDSKEITYNTEGPLFRVFVIDRQSPQEVLKGLAELTGTMEMPPRWALGYQQCRFSYASEQRVREIANTFREKQIPCDAIWMDIDYMEGFRVFSFNKNNFPNPKLLNNDLHAKGFHSVFMIDPGVKADSSYAVYQSGSAKDIWVKDAGGREYHGKVWPGDCAFPDFTMPSARNWWAGLYRQFMATGVDGVWNDMNEPAVNDEALPREQRLGTMPYTNLHRGGGALPAGPHLLYHNAYGRLMVEATRQGVMEANPDKRPFVLTRANLLGGQRFAATWTGDNLADERFMKISVPMSITLGLSGQPFSGPDIGGFLGNTSPDLWAKWLGFGVFLPFARGHACAGTNNKEPWAFGDAVETTSKIAISRRYRLLPLFYTLFYNAHKTGLPVMQPSFFADPKDLNLRNEEQTFLLGNKLLVVPSFTKDAKLPAGKWEQVSLVEGEQSDPYQAKLLLKSGAIIPAGKVIQNTGDQSLETLTLFVNLDSNGTANGELYWDSGEGWEFKKGKYSYLKFHATKHGNRIILRVIARQGSYPINEEVSHLKVVVLRNGKEYVGTGSLKQGVSVQM